MFLIGLELWFQGKREGFGLQMSFGHMLRLQEDHNISSGFCFGQKETVEDNSDIWTGESSVRGFGHSLDIGKLRFSSYGHNPTEETPR